MSLLHTLTEAAPNGLAATAVEGKPGRFLIELINPGVGSSGYYSPEVLEAAGKEKVFPAGTHMYLDHPTKSDDQFERPERSLRDLTAVLETDGYWDAELQRLVAEASVFAPYRGLLTEMAPNIGTSIRAEAEITENGIRPDGSRGRIINRLVKAHSVDFVTKAGRGGKILQVLESARVSEARNVGQHFESRIHQHFTNMADSMAADGRLTRPERLTLSGAIGDALEAFNNRIAADAPHLYQRDPFIPVPHVVPAPVATESGITEATSNDIRDALQAALKDLFGGEKQWAGVRDFDDTTVWFWLSTPDSEAMYQLGYELGENGAVSLTGSPVEVRATTTYVPVSPAGQSTTQESKEDPMATTQIEESDLARLREDASRVTALEAERDTAVQRADTAETRATTAESELARRDRTDVVARIIGEAAEAASVELDQFQTDGIAARAVNSEDGTLNEAATRTAFDAAIATLVESTGASGVRGLGGPVKKVDESTKVSESDLDAIDDATFGAVKED